MPPSSSPFRFSAVCCSGKPTAADDPDPSGTAITASSSRKWGAGDRSSTASSSPSSASSLSALAVPAKFSPYPCNDFSSRSAPESSSCHFELLSSMNTRNSGAAVTAVSPHSKPFLYVASGSEVYVHDLAGELSLVEAFSDGRSSAAVKAMAFSADGSRLLTGHHDGRIRVWATHTAAVAGDQRHRLVGTLPTAVDRLLRFAFPSNYVVVRRHHRRLWIRHADAVSSLAVAGDLVYSASWDKSVKVWSAGGCRCRESIPAHDDAVSSVAASADGATIYTASADRRVRVWARAAPRPERQGRAKHELVATLERHRSAVNAVALSPDGSRLYSGGGDRTIVVWRTAGVSPGGQTTFAAELRGHDKAVMCLAAAGDLVVSGSTDRTLRIWRRVEEEHRCVAVLTGHRKGVRSVSACRVAGGGSGRAGEEYRVCSGSSDGEVLVWRVLVSGEDRRSSGNCCETRLENQRIN